MVCRSWWDLYTIDHVAKLTVLSVVIAVGHWFDITVWLPDSLVAEIWQFRGSYDSVTGSWPIQPVQSGWWTRWHLFSVTASYSVRCHFQLVTWYPVDNVKFDHNRIAHAWRKSNDGYAFRLALSCPEALDGIIVDFGVKTYITKMKKSMQVSNMLKFGHFWSSCWVAWLL